MRYILIILISVFLSCGRIIAPNEEFACKINGKVFRPMCSTHAITGTKYLLVEYTADINYIFISAKNNTELIYLKIKLPKSGKIEVGTYSIGGDLDDSKAIYYHENEKLNSSVPYNGMDGEVTITNSNFKELTGTFKFNAIGQVTKKTYKITKGVICRKC